MFDKLPPLTWLRAFEATARQGNFTRAAEELSLTPSAVSYQVRALERKLGHRLFDRQARRLSLTRSGRAYLPVVARAFADIDASTHGIFGPAAPGTVTLRCLTSLNVLWLVPRLGRLRRAQPDIPLRLLSASWAEGTGSDPIDIDIRYGNGSWSDGTVIPLMRHRVIPVRAPGPGAAPLAEGPLIELAGVGDTWRHFFARHRPGVLPPAPILTVDQSMVALDLAARGLGHALVAEIFARSRLDDGSLVRSERSDLPARSGHYIVLPDDGDRHRPAVTRVVDWLTAEARQAV